MVSQRINLQMLRNKKHGGDPEITAVSDVATKICYLAAA